MQTKKICTTKTKNYVFKFPLSYMEYLYLEEVANIWQVGLAEVVRRSIVATHQSLTNRQLTKVNQIAILETISAFYSELIETHNHAEVIINLMQENEKNIASQLQHLVQPINTTAIKVANLMNLLANNDQTLNVELQKNNS
jgi:hypothetical protein